MSSLLDVLDVTHIFFINLKYDVIVQSVLYDILHDLTQRTCTCLTFIGWGRADGRRRLRLRRTDRVWCPSVQQCQNIIHSFSIDVKFSTFVVLRG